VLGLHSTVKITRIRNVRQTHPPSIHRIPPQATNGLGSSQGIKVEYSTDGEEFVPFRIDAEEEEDELGHLSLEHRAGDFLFPLRSPPSRPILFVRFSILDNFGGSGSYLSKCYVYGGVAEPLTS
jgi:hypothetical protein